MAEPPDLEDLARRYLDLWQQQMTQIAADPELAETVRRLFGPWLGGGWPPATYARTDGERTDGATSRSASDRAPSRDRGDELELVARRLADVEKRLAALESGAQGGRRKAPARPRRTRS
jgi:hypothetical protein